MRLDTVPRTHTNYTTAPNRQTVSNLPPKAINLDISQREVDEFYEAASVGNLEGGNAATSSQRQQIHSVMSMSLDREANMVLAEAAAAAGTSSHHEISTSNYQSLPIGQGSKDAGRLSVNHGLIQITENDESPAKNKCSKAVMAATPSKHSVTHQSISSKWETSSVVVPKTTKQNFNLLRGEPAATLMAANHKDIDERNDLEMMLLSEIGSKSRTRVGGAVRKNSAQLVAERP